jgi:HSP20 family protein
VLSRYNVYSPLLPLWGVPSRGLPSTMSRLFQDFETAFTRPFAGAATRPDRGNVIQANVIQANVIRDGVRGDLLRGGGPRVQLRDHGDSISMLADLPGLRLDDVELSIEGETVTLKATPKDQPIPEGFSALRRERPPAALEWSFELTYGIDAAAASATLEQGRLSVTLPKAPAAKPHHIPVKAA